MRNSYRKRYALEIVKVIALAIFVLAFLVCILWGCMFVTDYIMFKNNRPTVFTNAHVEQTENGKVTYEHGMLYNVVTNEQGQKTLYLFNNKID